MPRVGGMNLPTSKHVDLSGYYDCPASLTKAWFEHCGVAHVAIRIWRSDLLSTGKIEIYTIEPHDPTKYSSGEVGRRLATEHYATCQQDFLRYASEDAPIRVDLAAMAAISAACPAAYATLATDQIARFAGVDYE